MPNRTSRPNILFPPTFALILCLFAAAQEQNPPKQESKAKIQPISSHVVLISVSGLRSDFVTSAESHRLRIPTIQSLRAKGSYAVATESVFPSQTIPAHATIVTGTLPADHGLTSDHPFSEKEAAPSEKPYRSAKELKTDTIWELARRRNLITAAVGFPITADAAINFNLPDDIDDSSKAAAAAEIIEKHRPNLALINFVSFDAAQRRYGLLSQESLRALEAIDGLVKKIIDAIERARIAETTSFIVISDSGMARVEKEFKPNVILAKKGWLISDSQGRIASWQAVAQSFGGSAAIFVRDPQDEILVREVEEFFNQQAEKPDSPIWRVIPRRDANRLGANPRAALYLDAAPSYVISSETTGSSVTKATIRAARGYAPSRAEMRGALIIAGNGIKSGARLEYARLIDIAPTIARLLGLEMKTARGRVLAEVIK
jgi:predicted AlkP superfamily pyrophosphatase or phosphodiesterase